MTIINSSSRTTASLQIGDTLNVDATAGVAHVIERGKFTPIVVMNMTQTFGPFDVVVSYNILCMVGTVNVGQNRTFNPKPLRYETSVQANQIKTVIVPVGSRLRLAESAGATGYLLEQGSFTPTLYVGSTQTLGPFDVVRRFTVACFTGEIPVSTAWFDGAVVTPTAAKPLIWDTDLDSDCDDVVATALLMEFVRLGEAQVLAVVLATNNNFAAPAMRALLDYAGLTAVPIGSTKGTTVGGGADSLYTQPVRDAFRAGETRATYADPVPVLRQALAGAPDASVAYAIGGTCTNLRALLESPADGISPLTGVQLVAAKVASVHIMGGNFADNTQPEANIAYDISAANYVAQNCPVTIYWCGAEVGQSVFTRIPWHINPTLDPYQLAWQASTSQLNSGSFSDATLLERSSWDLYAVYSAVRGEGALLSTSAPGTASFAGTGQLSTLPAAGAGAASTTTWTPGAAGKHRYRVKTAADATQRNTLNALIYSFTASRRPNLIGNPRFDQADGALAAPWNTSLSAGTFTVNVANGVLNMTSSGSANRARVHQDLGVLPAGSYEYANTIRGGSYNFAIEDTLSTGNIVAANGVSGAANNGQTRGTFTLLVPTQVYARIERTSGTSGTTFNVDSVAVAKLP